MFQILKQITNYTIDKYLSKYRITQTWHYFYNWKLFRTRTYDYNKAHSLNFHITQVFLFKIHCSPTKMDKVYFKAWLFETWKRYCRKFICHLRKRQHFPRGMNLVKLIFRYGTKRQFAWFTVINDRMSG